MKRTPFVIYGFYRVEDERTIISAITKAFQTQVLKIEEHVYYFEIDMEPFGDGEYEVLAEGINKQNSDNIIGFSCHTLVPYGNTTRIRLCKYGHKREKPLECLDYDDIRRVISVSDYLTTDLGKGGIMYATIR